MATMAATMRAAKAARNNQTASSSKGASVSTATTNVAVTTDTPESLASDYCTIQAAIDKTDAPAKWRWSRLVSMMIDCTADKSSKTNKIAHLAELVGVEIRGKAYSATWVKQHVAAYKKYPNGVSTPEEYRAFLLAVNGNTSRDEKPAEPKAEKPAKTDDEKAERDFLADVSNAVKRALAAGLTPDQVMDAVIDGGLPTNS